MCWGWFVHPVSVGQPSPLLLFRGGNVERRGFPWRHSYGTAVAPSGTSSAVLSAHGQRLIEPVVVMVFSSTAIFGPFHH
jgi:hypothetical protein